MAVIQAIVKLVTHEKGGSTSHLAEGFDLIIESKAEVKHMSLYHE